MFHQCTCLANDIVGFRFEFQEIPYREDKVPEGHKIKSSYDLKRE